MIIKVVVTPFLTLMNAPGVFLDHFHPRLCYFSTILNFSIISLPTLIHTTSQYSC